MDSLTYIEFEQGRRFIDDWLKARSSDGI